MVRTAAAEVARASKTLWASTALLERKPLIDANAHLPEATTLNNSLVEASESSRRSIHKAQTPSLFNGE